MNRFRAFAAERHERNSNRPLPHASEATHNAVTAGACGASLGQVRQGVSWPDGRQRRAKARPGNGEPGLPIEGLWRGAARSL